MTRKALLFLLLVLTIATSKAQQSETLAKLSPMLKKTVKQENRNSARHIMTLLSFNDRSQRSGILAKYGCRVVDSIGHIYIVDMPCSALGSVAADSRVQRIEAEPMPQPAMDVTPGQINANPVYEGGGTIVEDVDGDGYITIADVTAIYSILLGISNNFEATADVNGDGYVNSADVTLLFNILLGYAQPTHVGGNGLPQAFTGKGVAAGVFDKGFDFTHPAFIDANGNSRARYYYDFCWQNEDGTLGRAFTTPQEIADSHSVNASASLHGTHVMGIMAGNAVNGKYQGMAPEADIYAAHFNSFPKDFDNPDEMTSAVCVLGFKYIFDQAEKDGKPCVINFSSGESFTINHQRILEAEALKMLTGPGKIIVACAGNDGHHSAYMEKPDNVADAGTVIVNGVAGGHIIDMDIVTPVNQRVYFGFLSLRLVGNITIEKIVSFPTDSVLALADTCRLTTTVMAGEITLKAWKSDYDDERGDVIHVHGIMPNPVYLLLYGAAFALSGDGPAWVYSDIEYSPFVNLSGSSLYSYAQDGHSMWWPGTLDGIISVGATGYKSSFTNIDGNVNNTVADLAAQNIGKIARFSSRGPTYEGLTKPDVVAPGVSINAAFNGYVEQTESVRSTLTDQVEYNGKTYYYTAQSGTSMASPVVAGSIALWLQANPELTPSDIIEIIAATSSHPDDSMEYPNNTYGYGQIDVYKGLLYIYNTMTTIPKLSDHQPSKAQFHLNDRMLTVDFASSYDQDATIIVYDLNGIKCAAATGTSINLSDLPSGVYAVQLITNNKSTTGSTLIRL